MKLKLIFDRMLSKAGAHNDNINSNNISFTIKDSKVCVPVVTLSAKENQKLSKPFSKEFKRSLYCNEYKTKKMKNTTNEYRYFLKSNFVRASRLYVLAY